VLHKNTTFRIEGLNRKAGLAVPRGQRMYILQPTNRLIVTIMCIRWSVNLSYSSSLTIIKVILKGITWNIWSWQHLQFVNEFRLEIVARLAVSYGCFILCHNIHQGIVTSQWSFHQGSLSTSLKALVNIKQTLLTKFVKQRLEWRFTFKMK